MDTIKTYALSFALLILLLLSGCKNKGGTTGAEPEPTNSALQLSLTAPSVVEVPLGELSVSYSIVDEDGLVSAELTGDLPNEEGNFSFTRTFEESVTVWDTTITRMIDRTGRGRFGLKAVSNTPDATEEETEAASTTFNQRETTEAQFASSFGLTRANTPISYALRVTDPDGLARITLKELNPNATNTTITEFTPEGIDFEQIIERTFSNQGEYTNIIEVEDIYGEIASDTNAVTVYAPLVDRTITVQTGFEGISVDFELNEEQKSGITNSEGQFIATFTAPEDSLMTYTLTADALGLVKEQNMGNNSGDESIEITPEKVPIAITFELPGQYPGEQKTHDIAELVTIEDTEGEVPVELTLSYNGLVFEVSNEGTLYTFTPKKGYNDTVEDFRLNVVAPFDNIIEVPILKKVFAPREIFFLQTNFETVEKDSVVIEDIRSILDSEAEITSVTASSGFEELEVRMQGEWGVVLKPLEELSNETKNYSFFITAENIDGLERVQAADLFVESLPEFSATVVDHVNEQAVGKAYMVIEGASGAVIDSLIATGGVFSNVEIPAQATGFRFGELRNERPYALEHRIFPEENGNHVVPVANRDKVDYWKNVIGTFIEDEIMRSWADTEITWGHGGFAGFNNNLDGNPGGYFLNRLPEFKNTPNGQPLKVIVAKNLETQYYVDSELITEHDSLTQQALDAIVDIYNNEFRVINPKLPPLDIQQNVVYKAFDVDENKVYINPLSKSSDPIGTISVVSTREVLTSQYGNIQHMRISVKSGSPTEPTERSQRFVFYAEGVPAFFGRGRIPAYNSSPQETATNDNFNVSDVIPNEIFGGQETGVKALDVWRSYLTNSSLYQQAPNGGRFSNASIIPKIWAPDYQSLKTFCKDIDRGRQWCDDPNPYD